MTFCRAFIAAVAAAALLPSAGAAGVRLVTREEPPGTTRARALLVVGPAPIRFNLVGLHWKGSGRVWFRTASVPGDWSAWHPARPEGDDLPDPGTAEARSAPGWKLGNPYWTGPARFIQYRFSGRVVRLRAHFVWSDPAPRVRTAARATAPAIIRRAEWGADESIVRAPPYYADAVRFAVVHHTAGSNSYSAAESAAIVRGIQRYHVLANGWNDIGYNFLVDKYGQIFEGRAGGVARNVVGAHAQGFNTGSTGVAVLGTYERSGASRAARGALVRIVSWRLDLAHADPLGRLTWESLGNPRFPPGTPVRVRAVSGHRDTGQTSCPGDALYGQLDGIASAAAARGLPKLYDPVASGGLGGPVRITARLSSALPWTVTIADGGGETVAHASGTGTTVNWTWDASSVLFGSYRYTIAAGPDVRPAAGPVSGPPALAIPTLRASPRVLTPNGDGIGEATTLSFSLTTAASARVDIANSAGSVVRTLLAAKPLDAGTAKLRWNGRRADGSALPDGRYRLRVTAESAVQRVARSRGLVLDRTLGHFSVEPPAFSPNGDLRLDSVTLGFELVRAADVRLRIMAGAREIVRIADSSAGAGAHSFVWNGHGTSGRIADGTYAAVVDATTTLGTRRLRRPLVVDTVGPRLRVLSASRRNGLARLRLSLSEDAELRIRYGTRMLTVHRDAGLVSVWYRTTAVWANAVAWDAAANRSARVFARFG